MGWRGYPDKNLTLRVFQFLTEAKDCGNWESFRIVARQYAALIGAEYQHIVDAERGVERQQPNEGPE